MNPLRILYDGWPLCREPNSPAALHLLAILAYLPESVEPILVFPETPPAWMPDLRQAHIEPTPATARLNWEQHILPQLRQTLNTHLLHLMTETASLLNGAHTVISPTQAESLEQTQPHETARSGLISRLRAALAAGGTSRARALFWPADLPPRPGRKIIPLSPTLHPDFTPEAWVGPLQIPGVEVPETYVLCHIPQDTTSLRRALEAWTWAAGPVGQNIPLVMLGLGKAARVEAEAFARALDVWDTITLLPAIPPEWVAPLYRRAEVIFHPAGVSAWGGAIRHALACGKPVVAAETAWASALVGPAAILVDPEDTRRLGASVIGVLVKEELSARLREAATARSAGWTDVNWGDRLGKAYAQVLEYSP